MSRSDSRPRNRLFTALLASLIAGASATAAAQPVPVPSLAWPGLTESDIARMHAAAARLYEGQSIGTVERWRNPVTDNAGEVMLIRSFDTHGMPCRTIDYTVKFATAENRLDHYTVNWCRVSDGSWKIIELPEPH
ncbi:MAG TPA: hypothetical protein VMA37_17625 [Acetobacteraceae bacterium]|nr:hypothetical protein [Acetobacteraceae bacterium]